MRNQQKSNAKTVENIQSFDNQRFTKMAQESRIYGQETAWLKKNDSQTAFCKILLSDLINAHRALLLVPPLHCYIPFGLPTVTGAAPAKRYEMCHPPLMLRFVFCRKRSHKHPFALFRSIIRHCLCRSSIILRHKKIVNLKTSS